MEIFHKGSDPPPLIFGSYGTGATHLILVTKKGKNKTFQKHLKWPYLKELFCKKCIKVMEPPPPFNPKFHNFATQKKCVAKLWIGSDPPPPPPLPLTEDFHN